MLNGGQSPEAILKPLRDYQSFAADWLLERLYVREWPGAGLFLDPGLGKTRTTLTVVQTLIELGHIRKALVVAPLRPVYTVWPYEIRRWGFPLSNIVLHKQHAKAMSLDLQVELVNFEGLVKLKDIRNRWDIIIIDESTFVKNWGADRTKFMRKMVKYKGRQVVILSGTPAANSLHDLHAQHFMIDKGERLGKTVGAFRARFCHQGGWMGRKWLVRSGVADLLLEEVKDTCLRMKAEDHLDMPELVENDIWCKMGKNPYNQYKKLKRELFAELETGDVIAATAAAAYTKCKQFANGQVYAQEGEEKVVHNAHAEKINALLELREELAGKPLLVFYHYSHDRDRIKALKPFKDAPVLSGGMNIKAVEKILGEWNEGKHHAILAQWQAASHGLNMQGCCNDIACFGLHDSLEIYDQAIRRVYRQGVTGNQVRIHRILMLDTVDEVMLERLRTKMDTQEEFLNALKKHARAA